MFVGVLRAAPDPGDPDASQCVHMCSRVCVVPCTVCAREGKAGESRGQQQQGSLLSTDVQHFSPSACLTSSPLSPPVTEHALTADERHCPCFPHLPCRSPAYSGRQVLRRPI